MIDKADELVKFVVCKMSYDIFHVLFICEDIANKLKAKKHKKVSVINSKFKNQIKDFFVNKELQDYLTVICVADIKKVGDIILGTTIDYAITPSFHSEYAMLFVDMLSRAKSYCRQHKLHLAFCTETFTYGVVINKKFVSHEDSRLLKLIYGVEKDPFKLEKKSK